MKRSDAIKVLMMSNATVGGVYYCSNDEHEGERGPCFGKQREMDERQYECCGLTTGIVFQQTNSLIQYGIAGVSQCKLISSYSIPGQY